MATLTKPTNPNLKLKEASENPFCSQDGLVKKPRGKKKRETEGELNFDIAQDNKTERGQRCIVAQCDIGWGNTLFIRGEGGELSWEQGIPMECNDGQWVYACKADDVIEYKLLINDEQWALGENCKVECGQNACTSPSF